MTTDPDMPATVEAELSLNQVDNLFRDLTLCATVQHISLKYATDVRPEDRSTLLDNRNLVQARHLLDRESIRAVQLRYEFDNALWIDTLSRRGATSYHLLRIQHATS